MLAYSDAEVSIPSRTLEQAVADAVQGLACYPQCRKLFTEAAIRSSVDDGTGLPMNPFLLWAASRRSGKRRSSLDGLEAAIQAIHDQGRPRKLQTLLNRIRDGRLDRDPWNLAGALAHVRIAGWLSSRGLRVCVEVPRCASAKPADIIAEDQTTGARLLVEVYARAAEAWTWAYHTAIHGGLLPIIGELQAVRPYVLRLEGDPCGLLAPNHERGGNAPMAKRHLAPAVQASAEFFASRGSINSTEVVYSVGDTALVTATCPLRDERHETSIEYPCSSLEARPPWRDVQSKAGEKETGKQFSFDGPTVFAVDLTHGRLGHHIYLAEPRLLREAAGAVASAGLPPSVGAVLVTAFGLDALDPWAAVVAPNPAATHPRAASVAAKALGLL